MKVRVLGCSGGIYDGAATTSFLIDDDILIDAGTGVCDLSLEQMRRIRHIFITHSHLDHIASIPLLADTLFEQLMGRPLVIHALADTLEALQKHIFNWQIWPDFTELPQAGNGVLSFESLTPGQVLELDGRRLEAIAVNHAVPCVGYRIETPDCAFAFSGDTTTNDSLWDCLNRHARLDLLFVETAFADEDCELAQKAFHYCPKLLATDLPKLNHRPKICITHLKPGNEERIMQQCRQALPEFELCQLHSGDIFEL